AGAADFLKWVGIEQQQPVAALWETIEVLNLLTTGAPAPLDGRFLRWSGEAYLRFTPLRRVPIYLGALRPPMLALIGELADGGPPLLFPPEHYATVRPYIEAGAARAGRDLARVDVAACVWCSISDDRAAAQRALRDKIAYYGHALSPLIMQRLGLSRTDFA